VRPLTRTAVETAIKDLSYRPNIVARHLRSARTHTLGLIMESIATPMSARAIRGAESVADASGYALLLVDAHGDAAIQARHLQSLIDRRVDGLLFPVPPTSAVARVVVEARVPAVVFGQVRPQRLLPTAMIDERAATEQAIDDLARQGHRRYGLIRFSGSTSAPRLASLTRTIESRGAGSLVFDAEVATGKAAHAAFLDAMQRESRPTALLVSPHTIAPFVIRAARDARIGVPAGLSLVAFGDSDWALAVDPPLSVISVDYEEHLREATALLLRHIAREPGARTVVTHASRYIPRDSVGRAPA
jgi:LacI family transcriptional regulator